eukprot:6361178-Alexandrium_andersonii.AAC.1
MPRPVQLALVGATRSRRSSHRPDTCSRPSTVSATTSRASARSLASRARRGTTRGGGRWSAPPAPTT